MKCKVCNGGYVGRPKRSAFRKVQSATGEGKPFPVCAIHLGLLLEHYPGRYVEVER